MIRNQITAFIALLIGFCVLVILTLFAQSKKANTISASIIVPIEHSSMTSIVEGFKKGLKEHSIELNVQQAHGDASLRRALIDQNCAQQTDILAAIGTAATQEIIASAFDGCIISLASSTKSEDIGNKKGIIISDEIPVAEVLHYLSCLMPSLKEITIVHSASEKVLPEVEAFSRLAHKQLLNVHTLLVPSLAELPLIIDAIPTTSQAVLIFADLLVMSGLQTIIQKCDALCIPLICPDEGCVRDGGSFGIGVQLEQLGYQGALEAINLFHEPKQLPRLINIDAKCLYVNQDKLPKGLTIAECKQVADRCGYSLVIIQGDHHA